METITKSPSETKSLGCKIANSLKGGEILALSGNLGSGKTTFIQGLAEGLGVKARIISPTFILMRKYDTRIMNYELGIMKLYHVDLYRLEENIEQEIKNLGIYDLWRKEENVFAIEWAEKIKSRLPKNTIWITFEYVGGDKRRIKMNSQ